MFIGISCSPVFSWNSKQSFALYSNCSKKTNGEQVPWLSASLTGKFCFASCEQGNLQKQLVKLLKPLSPINTHFWYVNCIFFSLTQVMT